MLRRLWRACLRFAFHHFYNTFAFTYDIVSRIVSRGHWRVWTRAAIPYIKGERVLEMPCGTGNLLLDLSAVGYAPIGVDLSSAMLEITQGKLRRVGAMHASPLIRARAQALPFASAVFDSITMTFPPSFVREPNALAELHRILRPNGRLIWVDAGQLLPIDLWSRALNAALNATGGGGVPFVEFARATLSHANFETDVQIARDRTSQVRVVIASKRSIDES